MVKSIIKRQLLISPIKVFAVTGWFIDRLELNKNKSKVKKLKPIAPIGIIPSSIEFFDNFSHVSDPIPIPIANGEGRYYANPQLLDDLKKNNQIVFTYQNHVNGSAEQIAGVCNEDCNVVGMMPHPERATESLINPLDNKPSSLIFESLIDAIGVKNWVYKNTK